MDHIKVFLPDGKSLTVEDGDEFEGWFQASSMPGGWQKVTLRITKKLEKKESK